MSNKTKATIAVTVLASSVYLSGCGLFGGDKEKVDPPQDVSYLKEGQTVETSAGKDGKGKAASSEANEQTQPTELYLINKDGYVMAQTLQLPKTEGIAKEALEYLVANGPVSEMLPNGFRAVLPADTEVLGVDIKDGVAVADFSKEFSTYQAEDEQRILQAVTWTLTQFDSVKRVELRVNGTPLTEMPVNGTPINSNGLSRADGINMDTSGVADITNTHPVTVYYLSQNGEGYNYVPVTKRVDNSVKDDVAAVVNELVNGPGYNSNLVTDFLPDAKLVDAPTIEDGTVTLNFNESILGSLKEKKVSEYLMNSLVLSLTEQPMIQKVAIEVNGSTELVNEDGKSITEPVSRPEKVNTGSF
ncbi:GerMN domain-containing protein [Falsibacillus pallidus]|uniref:Germination protein M n=1 Tax=Falsibacillus pallidus TaxID=493781 RepID=A0A370GKJ6_9BACI|nr:GerMN domain-containing protein [Falsibacillus pallidus]RDI44191.1 germination protein M [Falsibacillus pallidus]